MRKSNLSIRILLLSFLVLLTLSAAAQAQATRTWVSGVGDDANPCSRTAPCKTFAGAISKTTADATVENTQLNDNSFGIQVQDGGRVVAKNTTATNSTASGFIATSAAAGTAAAQMFLDSCVSAHNALNGILSNGTAIVRITGCTTTANGSQGLNGTGQIISFKNNYNDGNFGATNGAPTSSLTPQ